MEATFSTNCLLPLSNADDIFASKALDVGLTKAFDEVNKRAKKEITFVEIIIVTIQSLITVITICLR